MFTKRAVDWRAIGHTLLTPEVLGAIIGGAGAPLATYLARRKKKIPLLQRIAELLGAGVLGAGAGAGVGYGGKKGLAALLKLFAKAPEAAPDIPEVVPTWGEPGEAEILEKMRREAGEEVIPTWGEPGEAEILEKMHREAVPTRGLTDVLRTAAKDVKTRAKALGARGEQELRTLVERAGEKLRPLMERINAAAQEADEREIRDALRAAREQMAGLAGAASPEAYVDQLIADMAAVGPPPLPGIAGEPGAAEILDKARSEGILTPAEADALFIKQVTRPLAGKTRPRQKSRGKKTTGAGRGVRPWGLGARESLGEY